MAHKPHHTHGTWKERLNDAEQQVRESGGRWTDMRSNVLESILKSRKPLTAYKIIEILSAKLERDVKPASVYRSLDALSEMGIIVRIESTNAYASCQHPHEDHHHIFLVCRDCGIADELVDEAAAQSLTKAATHLGFSIEKQVMELQGYCKGCHP